LSFSFGKKFMSKKTVEALVKKVNNKLVAIASNETKDRMGDVIKADGWALNSFKKNPVLLFAHQYNIPPIGVAKNIKIEGNKLTFEPVFHNITQLAREIKAMFESDPPIMRAFSVGFLPLKFNEDDFHIIEKQELLEISAVPVPANQDALISISKSLKPEEEKSISEWIKEYEEEKEVEETKEEEKEVEIVEEVEELKEEETKEEEKTEEEVNEVIEKEGRILSKKSKKAVSDAIVSLKLSISVLKDLLDLSEPDKEDGEDKSSKGRKEVVQKSRKNRVMVRALQKIVKDVNNTLKYAKEKEN
jgi:uncharacterized protein